MVPSSWTASGRTRRTSDARGGASGTVPNTGAGVGGGSPPVRRSRNMTADGSEGTSAGPRPGASGHGAGVSRSGRVRRPRRKPSAATPTMRAAARSALHSSRAAASEHDPKDAAQFVGLCEAAIRALDAGACPDAMLDVANCTAAAFARCKEAGERYELAARETEALREKLEAARKEAVTLRSRAEGASVVAECILRTAVTSMVGHTGRNGQQKRPGKAERQLARRCAGRDASTSHQESHDQSQGSTDPATGSMEQPLSTNNANNALASGVERVMQDLADENTSGAGDRGLPAGDVQARNVPRGRSDPDSGHHSVPRTAQDGIVSARRRRPPRRRHQLNPALATMLRLNTYDYANAYAGMTFGGYQSDDSADGQNPRR